MLSILVNSLNFFIDAILMCCNLGVIIGYSIVYVISICINWTIMVLEYTVTILRVLAEDFVNFMRDVIDMSEVVGCKVQFFIEEVSDGYFCKATAIIPSIYNFIVTAGYSFTSKLIAFAQGIRDLSRFLSGLIIDALCLIGSSTKDIFTLLIFLIYNMVTAPLTSFVYICSSLYNFVLLTKQTILNLPLESAIGFCVVVIFITLFRKYNGKRILKFIFLLSTIAAYRIIQMVIAALIVSKWSVLRFLKNIKVPKFSGIRSRAKSTPSIDNECTKQLRKELEEEKSLRVCVICMSSPRDSIVLPCWHFCMCSPCAKQIRHLSNECPVCRKNIRTISHVYM